MNSTDDLRQRAYNMLGVTPQQVAEGIQVSPQLKAIAATIRRAGQPKITKSIDGVILQDVEHQPPYGPGSDVFRSWPWYLQTSAEPDATKILTAYYALYPSMRKLLPIEAFCHAAKLSPLRALEIITATCVRLGAQAATIISAVNHPRVVEKTVEMALTDGGVEDRTLLHKAAGFLPQPKGAQTNIQLVQNAQATAQAAAAVPAPPPEQTIRRMINRFNDAKLLVEDVGNVRLPDVMPASEIEEAVVLDAASTTNNESEEEEAEMTP